MSDTAMSRRIAEGLLSVQAVTFSPEKPFRWASGLRAPIYCDNRVTISYPSVRRSIREGFEAVIDVEGLAPEIIVGTATAGIPHAAWLADRLDLPMAYVRSKPKSHGRGTQIEGRVAKGQRAVVIEDLVSTGGSSRVVVEALRESGVVVAAVLAIFSYGLEEAFETYAKLGMPLFTLTGFDALFAAATAGGKLSDFDVESIRDWRKDPHSWSDRHR